MFKSREAGINKNYGTMLWQMMAGRSRKSENARTLKTSVKPLMVLQENPVF